MLVVVFAVGILATVGAYLSKKRRTRRQGRRLGSTADLSEPKPTSSEMKEGEKPAGSHVYLFLAADNFLSSRNSRTSFATNSSSSRSVDYRASLSGAPSTFCAASRSSGYTLDADGDSLSPFSDIHLPGGVRTASRNNVHSRHESVSSFQSDPQRLSTHTQETVDVMSLLSTRSPPSSTGATYGREHDFDDEDLISLSSSRRAQ